MASQRSSTTSSADDDDVENMLARLPTSSTDARLRKPAAFKSKDPARPHSPHGPQPPPAAADGHIFAELDELQSEIIKPSTAPRAHTPTVRDGHAATPEAKPRLAHGHAEDNNKPGPRRSTESVRSLKTAFTPSAGSAGSSEGLERGLSGDGLTSVVARDVGGSGGGGGGDGGAGSEGGGERGGGGGGWWGGLLSTASAAMRQAEAAVKEIQQTEEARRWAEQVKGNVGVLRGLGDELRSRAMPTFANILHTIAPPISSHERLLVHITHCLVGYPALNPTVHAVFGRVMSQVEGGDLLVVQRGQESNMSGSGGDGGGGSSSGGGGGDAAGWQDGPWWRQTDDHSPRSLGLVHGLAEGTSLCRASAESYAREHLAAQGGLEQARARASDALAEESNPVRTSDLFLAVQAIATEPDPALFCRAAEETDQETKTEPGAGARPQPEQDVCFAVFVLDPVHELAFSTVSQPVPARWVRWMDERSSSGQAAAGPSSSMPDEIRDLVDGGAVDPREWVAEWLEEVLSLAVGVVAQRYVARRMGVAEGDADVDADMGLGRGKMRMQQVMENNAGEAARAGLI